MEEIIQRKKLFPSSAAVLVRPRLLRPDCRRPGSLGAPGCRRSPGTQTGRLHVRVGSWNRHRWCSRRELTCVSASAYTRTTSSVPEGRTKERARLYLLTKASMASCRPAGLTGRLSASVVSITRRSATWRNRKKNPECLDWGRRRCKDACLLMRHLQACFLSR